jgi:hypothetical protein
MPHLLSNTDRDRIAAHNLDLVSAAKIDVTDEMMLLAEQLAQIHGRIRVCNESSGVHFYISCPACIENDPDEVYKSHLAINASLYFEGSEDMDKRVALCMKEHQAWSVSDLLSIPPLDERGYELRPKVIKVAMANLENLEQNPITGAWEPKGPGEATPVHELPANHPAQLYLRSRGFNAEDLWVQFRLSYCSKERNDVCHRRLLNGFRTSPQGRLIFYIDMDGIQKGWQSRVIEMEQKGFKYYYNGYTNKWVRVLKKVGEKWEPVTEKWKGWDPAKYVLATGCRRNECLMGWDAAVKWNETNSKPDKFWCVMAEGPLDIARVFQAGFPSIAILGKAFSENQAKLVADRFSKVIYVQDIDVAGDQAAASVVKRFDSLPDGMAPEVKIVKPDGVKDLGAMPVEAVRKLITCEF